MRVGSSSPRPLPVQPAVKAAAPSVPAAPAAASTPAPAKPTVEADVNVQVDGTATAMLTGSVELSRTFMDRLIRHVTRKPNRFGPTNVAFDPASGTYGGTVQLKVKGVPITFAAKAKPVIEDNMPGFQFTDLGIRLFGMTLRLPGLKGLASKLIAKAISDDDIKSTPGSKGTVRLETTSLLHDIDVLPPHLQLDGRTRLSLVQGAGGDVRVNFDSPASKPAGANTPKSDIEAQADAAALKRVLAPLLAPDYQLTNVTLGQGLISLDGKVEAKPISDVINLFKGLAAIIRLQNGRPPGNTELEKAMIDLRLDLKIEGTQAVLKPSLSLALKDLEAMLKKAGVNPVREGDALRFDMAALGAKFGLEGIQVTPDAAKARAHIDIPGLIQAPILRGER